jgi:uncharacterized membrane protein
MLLVDSILLYIRDIIAVIGVAVICAGALRSVYQLLLLITKRTISANYIRLQFGNSVVLGLEFMMAGDLIGSLIKPDYYNLGLLAIIVGIRTILSFFLNLELTALSPQQQKNLK